MIHNWWMSTEWLKNTKFRRFYSNIKARDSYCALSLRDLFFPSPFHAALNNHTWYTFMHCLYDFFPSSSFGLKFLVLMIFFLLLSAFFCLTRRQGRRKPTVQCWPRRQTGILEVTLIGWRSCAAPGSGWMLELFSHFILHRRKNYASHTRCRSVQAMLVLQTKNVALRIAQKVSFIEVSLKRRWAMQNMGQRWSNAGGFKRSISEWIESDVVNYWLFEYANLCTFFGSLFFASLHLRQSSRDET